MENLIFYYKLVTFLLQINHVYAHTQTNFTYYRELLHLA